MNTVSIRGHLAAADKATQIGLNKGSRLLTYLGILGINLALDRTGSKSQYHQSSVSLHPSVLF